MAIKKVSKMSKKCNKNDTKIDSNLAKIADKICSAVGHYFVATLLLFFVVVDILKKNFSSPAAGVTFAEKIRFKKIF
jgi:hypothetical protein